jgi:hypothetical protein
MRIGIDIGNVIIGGGGDDTQFFTDQFLQTPAVAGAKMSIQRLATHDKVEVIHIISKCGVKTEERSIHWLNWNNLLGATVRPHNVHFVRKRHLKAPMAQALELDIFIDDRQDVLEHMADIVPDLILFTSWEQTNKELQEIFDAAAEG